MAPIWNHAKGCQTGWGATCAKHFDEGSAMTVQCKKQIGYGTGKNMKTDDETRYLLKAWLIMGLDIAFDDKRGKFKHVFQSDPTACTMSEAELDKRAWGC